jgi:hypothetical protein
MKISELKKLIALMDDNAEIIVHDGRGCYYSLERVATLEKHCKGYGCEEHGKNIYNDFKSVINPVMFSVYN